ncbi:MAG: MarR family transcriptional regulator [Planctomycetaceae bacterium]|nr:MarR family transcriptional regulator [Planctomycetaceae bacterium]
MADYDFEESLGYWLTVTTQAWHRTMIDRLSPDGITYRQMHVIGWLKFDGELSQAELARKMMIEPPTLVRILDRMEATGLLKRIDDPLDRRRRILRLTPRSEPIWDRITDCARELRAAAAAGLSAAEVAQLKRLLSKVHANLGAEESVPQPV